MQRLLALVLLVEGVTPESATCPISARFSTYLSVLRANLKPSAHQETLTRSDGHGPCHLHRSENLVLGLQTSSAISASPKRSQTTRGKPAHHLSAYRRRERPRLQAWRQRKVSGVQRLPIGPAIQLRRRANAPKPQSQAPERNCDIVCHRWIDCSKFKVYSRRALTSNSSVLSDTRRMS